MTTDDLELPDTLDAAHDYIRILVRQLRTNAAECGRLAAENEMLRARWNARWTEANAHETP